MTPKHPPYVGGAQETLSEFGKRWGTWGVQGLLIGAAYVKGAVSQDLWVLGSGEW